jgi:hypothetical protein
MVNPPVKANGANERSGVLIRTVSAPSAPRARKSAKDVKGVRARPVLIETLLSPPVATRKSPAPPLMVVPSSPWT